MIALLTYSLHLSVAPGKVSKSKRKATIRPKTDLKENAKVMLGSRKCNR